MQDALLMALAKRVEKERKRGTVTTKKSFRVLLEEVDYPAEMGKVEKKDFINRIIGRGFEAYLAGKAYKKSKKKIKEKKRVYAKKYSTSSVLYISEVGTFLGIAKNTIVLKEKGKVVMRMPKGQCERIIIASRSVSISGGVVKVCADMGIAIDFIDPFSKMPPYASLYGHKNAYAKMTLKQLQILNTPQQIVLAKAFIKGKIKNQINYLKYLNKYHDCFDEPILAIERKLKEMLLHAQNPNELMGYEGQCALNYWHALSKLLEDKVHFSHRVTLGAKDVVNASLNYGYAILYSRIQYHAVKAGLSIHISFLHALDDNKPTLVYDLIEEFRAFVVDRVVFTMFNQSEPIKLDAEGRLTLKSRQRITKLVLEKIGSFTKHKRASKKIDTIMSEQAFLLTRAIKGFSKYKPFIGKY
jgi:CRISPR-associated endonuclease Cas1